MTNFESILSIYKKEQGIATNEGVARSLGITATAMSNYKLGLRRPPDIVLVKIAAATQMELADLIAVVNLGLKTTPEEEKGFWLERVASLATVAAFSFLAALFVAPAPAQARATEAQSVYYVKCRNHRRRYIIRSIRLMTRARSMRMNPVL